MNGLGAIDPVSLTAPIDPSHPETKPQAEVQDVPLAVNSTLDRTLIGGPVTNRVAAKIDYTTTVSRGPYANLGGATATGPDITFYGAAAAAGYTPAVNVALAPFGNTGTGLGQRYWMYDVGFHEGSASVVSPSSGNLNGTSRRFLYDTGTDVTILRTPLATSLGLSLGSPDFTYDVAGLGLLPGFYLDSITMTGVGGTYTLLDAPVLVTSSLLGGAEDAIIGSNLFNQTTLLFDGPGARLGIGVTDVPVPEPSTILLVGGGLAARVAQRRRRRGIDG
jgi:hypothetical protein